MDNEFEIRTMMETDDLDIFQFIPHVRLGRH